MSTVEQAEQGYSLQDQQRRIKAYCEAREIELFGKIGATRVSPERIQSKPSVVPTMPSQEEVETPPSTA